MLLYLNKLVLTAENNYLNNLSNEIKKLRLNIDNFLDIGCDKGNNTLLIAKACNAKNIWGIDLNKEAIIEASKKGIKVSKQDLNSEEWKIEDDKYNFIYSNQVIEHLSSVDNYLKNIKRILKNDGYALISTENLSAWHNCFALILGYQPFSTTNICTKITSIGNPFSMFVNGCDEDIGLLHRAVFTYYSLLKIFKLYNLQIIKSITAGYYPLPNNKIGNFMAKIDKRHAVYIAVLVKNVK